jgi:hypothetical protein
MVLKRDLHTARTGALGTASRTATRTRVLWGPHDDVHCVIVGSRSSCELRLMAGERVLTHAVFPTEAAALSAAHILRLHTSGVADERPKD